MSACEHSITFLLGDRINLARPRDEALSHNQQLSGDYKSSDEGDPSRVNVKIKHEMKRQVNRERKKHMPRKWT